ncbi:MAG: hypothetical protein OEY28_08925, partial [Nitrospira sp.]|nr:hypothetical protein [Nitrospira sp.]
LCAVRLEEPRHSAVVFRRPGYAKLGAREEHIHTRSAEMVVETAHQLALGRPEYLVLDGGYLQIDGLSDRQQEFDEVLDCGECDDATTARALQLATDSAAEAQLEILCRSLHRVAREVAPLQVCLLPPASPLGLLQPGRMELVLSELSNLNVGYWHSTSNAALLSKLTGGSPQDWTARFGTKLRGVYLADTLGGHGEQPPGLGEIDFSKLAPELARATVRVLVMDEDSGTRLRFGTDHLAKVGIF